MRFLASARSLTSCSAVLAAFALLLACGGGTPPPKDADEVAPKSAAPAEKDVAPADTAESAPAARAPAASSDSAASAAAAAPLALPAGSDDPFMAHHQMPAAQVKGTVRAALGKVNACYRAGLKRDRSTFGDVKVRFVVTNDGKVRDWRDEGSSMSDGDVTKCIGEVIKDLNFPKQKSPGDAYGIYTIHLAP